MNAELRRNTRRRGRRHCGLRAEPELMTSIRFEGLVIGTIIGISLHYRGL
jgi:hypothetical protein